MKSYPHIITKLFYEPLVVTRARHSAMVRVLESRMSQGAVRIENDDDDDDDDDSEDEQDRDPGYVVLGETAIIPVQGVLVPHARDIPMSTCGCGLDDVAAMIDVSLADKEVKRLLFDFDTPGGAVTGVPEMGRKIASIVSKETVGFVDSECCSGGTWLMSQCQRAYTTSSASVGSIGVWCAYLDLSRQYANDGINVQEISAGKFKTMGAPWRALSAEEKAMIQKDVDRIYGEFKEAVNSRREIAEEFMQGQVFDGAQACEIGLCDGVVESVDEVLE